MSYSFEFKFDADRELLLQTLAGEIDYQDLISLTIELYNEPDYSPDMDCILDLSDCNLIMGFDEMAKFVDFLTNNENRLKGYVAIITNSPSTYGTTRIFAGLGEDLQKTIDYFETIAEAEHWLEKMHQKDGS